MKNRQLTLLILFLCPLCVNAQDYNSLSGNLTILDSVVVKKRCKDAVELNIHISFPTEETVTLYQFNENVDDIAIIVRNQNKDYGVYDAVKELNWSPGNRGLFYVIEDDDGKQIKAGFSDMFASYVDDNPKTSLVLVDKKELKVYQEKTEEANRIQEYNMAKTIVPTGGISVKLYPMIVRKLKRGHYKLFLCYSQCEKTVYEHFDTTRDKNGIVFNGVMVSNKIDLFVK